MDRVFGYEGLVRTPDCRMTWSGDAALECDHIRDGWEWCLRGVPLPALDNSIRGLIQ